MDIDEFTEKLSDYGNEKELWQEGIIVRVHGREVVDFKFDGNTSLNLILEDDPFSGLNEI